MENWKLQLKTRLEKAVAGLPHLSAAGKAALVESELLAAVEATEAGRPFGAAPEKPIVEEIEETETDQEPAPKPTKARSKVARVFARLLKA